MDTSTDFGNIPGVNRHLPNRAISGVWLSTIKYWIFASICWFACYGFLRAESFDHSYAAFSGLLQEHVTRGSVDYGGLKKDRKRLDEFVREISLVKEEGFKQWSKEQRLAFLINAYNAAVLQLVIDNYPVSSIKRIGGWFSKPFQKKFVRLFGTAVSLDDIEHGMLRQQFNEPRIHFALVCAARSCPMLRGEPYLPGKLDPQLDDQARVFLNDPSKNRVDLSASTIYLSAIFKWFGNDFGEDEDAIVAFAARYWPESIQRAVQQRKFKVRYLDYDWQLNDRKR